MKRKCFIALSYFYLEMYNMSNPGPDYRSLSTPCDVKGIIFFLTWIQCNFGWTHLIPIFLYYLKPCLHKAIMRPCVMTLFLLHCTLMQTHNHHLQTAFLFIFYSALQKWLSDFWKQSFLHHHLYPLFKFTNSSFSYLWSYPVPLEFQIIRSKCLQVLSAKKIRMTWTFTFNHF